MPGAQGALLAFRRRDTAFVQTFPNGPLLFDHWSKRHKIFEGPRKPELTAQKTLAKKREEFARVLEHLRSPGLTRALRANCARMLLSLSGPGETQR